MFSRCSVTPTLDAHVAVLLKGSNSVQDVVNILKDVLFLRVAWGRCNWDVMQVWMGRLMQAHTTLGKVLVRRSHFVHAYDAGVQLEVQRGQFLQQDKALRTETDARTQNRWLRGIVLVPTDGIEAVLVQAIRSGAISHGLNGFARQRLDLGAFVCDSALASKNVSIRFDVGNATKKSSQRRFAKMAMATTCNIPVSDGLGSAMKYVLHIMCCNCTQHVSLLLSRA